MEIWHWYVIFNFLCICGAIFEIHRKNKRNRQLPEYSESEVENSYNTRDAVVPPMEQRYQDPVATNITTRNANTQNSISYHQGTINELPRYSHRRLDDDDLPRYSLDAL